MRVSMGRLRILTLACCGLVLSACGLAKPMPRFDTFAHQLSDGTVALHWNCSRPNPGVVRVEGWANNPYYPGPITNLELLLYGVSAQDRSVSQAKGSAQDYQIQTNEPSSFSVELRTTGGEVRYDLVYQYWGGGGGGGRLGGMEGGRGERQQNMARDVCKGLAP